MYSHLYTSKCVLIYTQEPSISWFLELYFLHLISKLSFQNKSVK